MVLGLLVCLAAMVCKAQAAGRGAGAILGRVFIDVDEDGRWSSADQSLSDARLLTDTGLEVRSDARGRFHLFRMGTGREIGAGRVLMLDRSSLPSGARVVGSARRLLPLRPDEVVRIDFAVVLPKLVAADARGLGPVPTGPGSALELSADGRVWTWLTGAVPKDCAASLDGESLATDERGVFRARVPIEPGVNPHLVSLHCADGHLELMTLEIHWVVRESGGDMVIPAPARTLVVCAGPPAGQIPRTNLAGLSCRPSPGVELRIDGSTGVERGPLRRFGLRVAPGPNRFSLELRYAETPEVLGGVGWRVSPVHLTGSLYGNLALAYAFGDKTPSSSLFLGGKIGGHLQADLPWDLKLILTGGLESYETEDVFTSSGMKDIFEPSHATDGHERAPDPELGWLVSGDASSLIDRNPVNARYQVELRRKDSHLGWGGFVTSDGLGEAPGRYRRALVGGHGSLSPLEGVFDGDAPAVDLRLDGFWAQTDPADSGFVPTPAHEEFLGTGGSLYFLANPWVIEGSESIWVERRDRRTGLVTARRKLTRNRDYQLDWNAGRLILTDPADFGPLAESAVRLAPEGGSATVLVAEYEHVLLDASNPAAQVAGGGLRLMGRPVTGLVLSAEASGAYAKADGAGDYWLGRTMARVSYGEHLKVWGGWALSSGLALLPSYSVDGGLSHRLAAWPQRPEGEAYQAGLELATQPFTGRLSFRRYLDGFSDSSWLATGDLTQFQALVESRPADGWNLRGRFSSTELDAGQRFDGSLGVSWRVFQPLEISFESAYEGAFADGGSGRFERVFGDGQRLLVGLRGAWRVFERLTLIAGHQHTTWRTGAGRAGRDLTLSTVGGQVRLFDDLRASLEGGWGPRVGTIARLGLSQDRVGGSVFAHTTFAVDSDALRPGFGAGQSGTNEQGWVVSSSQNFTDDRSGEALGQRVGLQVPIGRSWLAKFAYERAELHNSGDGAERNDLFFAPFFDRGAYLAAPGRRNAVFGRLSYLGRAVLLSAAAEYRVDEQAPLASDSFLAPAGPTTHRQTLLRLAGRWQPLPELTLGGRIAWAETFGSTPGDSGPGLPEGGFLEASLGLAYRPAKVDWLRFLVRASAGQDSRPTPGLPDSANPGSEIWYRTSLAVMLHPTPYLQPTLVVAPWVREYRYPGDRDVLRKYGLTGMLRLGSALYGGLGLAGEVRVTGGFHDYSTVFEEEEEGVRAGYAAELFYQLEDDDIGGLRLSLGYSFSDIPDPLMSDLHTGQQGVFLRLEGML
jgi:hypothetical protein